MTSSDAAWFSRLRPDQRRALQAGSQPIYWPDGQITGTPTPGASLGPLRTDHAAAHRERLRTAGRSCWESLHSMPAPTRAAITAWLATVPAYGCGCQQAALDYIAAHPPPYHDLAAFRRWGFDFHCHIDAKTGDAPMSWRDACARWGWPE